MYAGLVSGRPEHVKVAFVYANVTVQGTFPLFMVRRAAGERAKGQQNKLPAVPFPGQRPELASR